MLYAIAENTEHKSLEVTFSDKPAEAVRDALKALHYRWHAVKRCWYGYTDADTLRAALDAAERGEAPKAQPKSRRGNAKAAAQNIYGVRVGDIFEASWGYEQTNVDFFQVVELVGKTSVRVREVYPERIATDPTGAMAADITYRMSRELLPAASFSVFIKDQERGDLKRIKPGYQSDPQEAAAHCYFSLDSFAIATRVNGDEITTYESWYA